MKNYYFTYGSNGHPFVGGWTKIEAPTRDIAVAIFRSIHPDKIDGLVNCSSIYDENEFHKTSMWRNGNFGKHEQEVVCMQHISMEGARMMTLRLNAFTDDEITYLIDRLNAINPNGSLRCAVTNCESCPVKHVCYSITHAIEYAEAYLDGRVEK